MENVCNVRSLPARVTARAVSLCARAQAKLIDNLLHDFNVLSVHHQRFRDACSEVARLLLPGRVRPPFCPRRLPQTVRCCAPAQGHGNLGMLYLLLIKVIQEPECVPATARRTLAVRAPR